jgi:hypothetical protein
MNAASDLNPNILNTSARNRGSVLRAEINTYYHQWTNKYDYEYFNVLSSAKAPTDLG